MANGEEIRERGKLAGFSDETINSIVDSSKHADGLRWRIAPNSPTVEEIVSERPELLGAPGDDEHLRVWACMPPRWQQSISPEQLRAAIDAVDTYRAARSSATMEDHKHTG